MTPFQRFIRVFTSSEAFFFYAVLAVMWIIIYLTTALPLTSVTKYYQFLGVGLGTAFWLWAIGHALPYFSVSVPEVTGLVTVNYLTGGMKAYGTGFHFRYPWEQVKAGNYINLRMMTTDNMQETFPCADGPVVIVKWSIQYRTSVEKLPAYISVDERIINSGLNEASSSFLALKIREMKSEDIRGTGKKQELEKDLFKEFQGQATVKHPGGRKGTVEEIYGIDIVLIPIADVDFESGYQEARSADQIMKKFRETASAIRKDSDGTITDKDALDNVLMVAGKGVKKEVRQETKTFDITPAGAEALKGAAGAFSRR